MDLNREGEGERYEPIIMEAMEMGARDAAMAEEGDGVLQGQGTCHPCETSLFTAGISMGR